DDLHLASVEHEVLVDEALERLVEHDALAVALVEALGLEDGVDLGAVVREVVDDRDRVGGDALPGGALVVGELAAGSTGHAGRRVERDLRVERAPSHAVRRVGAVHAGWGRRARRPAAGPRAAASATGARGTAAPAAHGRAAAAGSARRTAC